MQNVIMRPGSSRFGLIACVAAVLASAGCDLENPTRVTPENAEARRLIEGASARWEEAIRTIVAGIFVASDEGTYHGTNTQLYAVDETGDLSLYDFFQGRITLVSEARVLLEMAIERAEEKRERALKRKAHTWRGWTLIRLAEIWGDQPIRPGGPVLTQREILEEARKDFLAAIEGGPDVRPDTMGEAGLEIPVDSAYTQALAGIARINWLVGRSPVDPALLQEAIAAVDEALTLDPDLYFRIPVRANDLRSGMGGTYRPTPAFANYRHWWQETSTYPLQGTKFVDKDELWLIKAEAQLLLGDLEGAKQSLKRTPLLPRNLSGVVRQRTYTQPLLTPEEIDAYFDPLDEDGVLFAIRELQRENQYTHGRRNVGPDGRPILPVALPAGVY